MEVGPTAEKKQYPIDVDGSEIVSTVLMELLNTFPGLDGKRVQFATLGDASGIGFFPSAGAVILENRETVTGRVKQKCRYPFMVVYRAALRTEKQKLRIKELLDCLGKWLEGQPVTISEEVHQLEAYPDLAEDRKIKSIARTTPAYLNAAYDNGVEDWVISADLNYTTDYYR